ncbi:MAG: hypothetical protein ACM3OB_01530 [Acidobacteriota bacterium]
MGAILSKWKSLEPRERLRAIGTGILLLGLASALVIYLVASVAPAGPLGDQIGSKLYLHQLEVYGGKANILQDRFLRWFDGLWHGRELAGTVAFLTLLTFLGIRFATSLPHAERKPPGPPRGDASRRARGKLHLVDLGGVPRDRSSSRDRKSP